MRRFSWWHLTRLNALLVSAAIMIVGALTLLSASDDTWSRWVVYSLLPMAAVLLTLIVARTQRRIDGQAAVGEPAPERIHDR